ncbi:MAG: HAD family phosphatase [Selenomonadaceae bacterium]|nr:HAD family phosphatase [Selenomonadaceae bacterium]
MNTSIVKNLALFDLDGTLFDTNEVNYRAYQKALAHFGFKFEREYWYRNCIGRHYKDFLADIDITDEKILKEIHRLKKQCYGEFLPYAKENLHLFKLIALMKPCYHIALVTTASRQNVEDILQTFNRTETFDSIFTQEDVSKMKPDPECYLKAMDYFKVEPTNTIIFEDSEAGLLAAERSGAFYYKVFKFNERS